VSALMLSWSTTATTTAVAPTADRVWYVPNPGSLDLQRMFERPEEWAHARALIDVFQFTQQHTYRTPDAVTGPNFYDPLVRAGAFRALAQWKKKIALGVGAVKPQYCTADATGMQKAIAETSDAVNAIRAGGGPVSYLLMDEPFLSGRLPECGGPGLGQTADRLRTYMTAVGGAFPDTRIGLIEAYPSFSADEFASMLALLQQRGVLPAFLQLDVDLLAVPRSRRDLTADVRRMHQLCIEYGIPFGLILWGYNGDADALFARDANTLADAFRVAFPTWADLPDQLVVQSWAESSTGQRITPSNLPEDRPYTLTNILWQQYRRFRGETAAGTLGSAVPR
jgi:hypothetical protein